MSAPIQPPSKGGSDLLTDIASAAAAVGAKAAAEHAARLGLQAPQLQPQEIGTAVATVGAWRGRGRGRPSKSSQRPPSQQQQQQRQQTQQQQRTETDLKQKQAAKPPVSRVPIILRIPSSQSFTPRTRRCDTPYI